MPVVAVADFEAVNCPDAEAAFVSEFVRTALTELGTCRVVEKRLMREVLTEQAFQQTGCTSQDCAVKLGRVLNASKIVVGTYGLLGATRYLAASIVDVETGRRERAVKEKGFEPGNADEAAERVARALMAPGATAAADSGPKHGPLAGLALVPFETKEVPAKIGLELTPRALAGLAESGIRPKLTPDEVFDRREALGMAPCGSTACMIFLGRALGVRRIVFGAVGGLGESWHVDVKVLDVESGKMLFGDTAGSDDLDELTTAVGEIAGRIPR